MERRGFDLLSNPNNLVAKSLYFLVEQDRLVELDTIHSLFHYVTDSVVLESQMRLIHISMLSDLMQKGKKNETEKYLRKQKELEVQLAKTFGQKFCFKFQAITKESLGFQLDDS